MRFEFIIADFGSTDKSKAIATSYAAKDNRVKLHDIPHRALAEVRNLGCSLAQGQYIAIMDADDVSVPDRLMLEIAFMENQAADIEMLLSGIPIRNGPNTEPP